MGWVMSINYKQAVLGTFRVGGGKGSHTVVGHGQDGNLGDGTVPSFYTSSTLVDGGQISVHVTGVTTTTGHFFSGG
jgi:hypothetical protein